MCSTKECWLQKMTHLGLNSCFITLCSEISLSIIFIICKMGIKQDTCMQSLLQRITELTHAMCPGQAQSKFTVHVVSIIIIIMTLISLLILSSLLWFLSCQRVGHRWKKEARRPDTLQSNWQRGIIFSAFHAQNLLFWLQEIMF